MGFVTTAKQILFEPADFFKAVVKKRDYPIGKSLRLLVRMVALYALAVMLLQLIFLPFGIALQRFILPVAQQTLLPLSAAMQIVSIIVGAASSFGFFVAASFVSALVNLLWLKLWGAEGTYGKAYAFSVYSMAPWFLVGWVPLFGPLVAGWWALIFQMYATTRMYGVSWARAITMWLVLIALVLLLVLLVFGVAVLLIVLAASRHAMGW